MSVPAQYERKPLLPGGSVSWSGSPASTNQRRSEVTLHHAVRIDPNKHSANSVLQHFSREAHVGVDAAQPEIGCVEKDQQVQIAVTVDIERRAPPSAPVVRTELQSADVHASSKKGPLRVGDSAAS